VKHELWYSVVVRDRHGKVVSRERRRSRSFLKQWNQILYVGVTDALYNIKTTAGFGQNCTPNRYNGQMVAAASYDNQGIVIGTGTTPVAIDDYELEAQITQGLGAGQMEHLICTVDESVVAAPTCSFEVHRTIANNSGGVITVRESGIYVRIKEVVPVYFACGVRDVLAAPQAVPDGGAITIDWTIGVTI